MFVHECGHHGLAGAENRRRRLRQDIGQSREPILRHQHALAFKSAAGPQQMPENNLPFRHESALAADQVPLTDLAVGGDAGILRVRDGDRRHLPRLNQIGGYFAMSSSLLETPHHQTS